ncbi:hypothetical protein AVM02_04065 [Brucella anthropi]
MFLHLEEGAPPQRARSLRGGFFFSYPKMHICLAALPLVSGEPYSYLRVVRFTPPPKNRTQSAILLLPIALYRSAHCTLLLPVQWAFSFLERFIVFVKARADKPLLIILVVLSFAA